MNERVITGHGAFKITIVDGGIAKFECWHLDDEGKVKAYFHAPPTPGDWPDPPKE